MKSPIKDRPLRNPGQSLDWRILDVIMDREYTNVYDTCSLTLSNAKITLSEECVLM